MVRRQRGEARKQSVANEMVRLGHATTGLYNVTLTTTDIPGSSDTGASPAMEIFTGTRCVTLVKLPEALFGGISENWAAVFVPICSIRPKNP